MSVGEKMLLKMKNFDDIRERASRAKDQGTQTSEAKSTGKKNEKEKGERKKTEPERK